MSVRVAREMWMEYPPVQMGALICIHKPYHPALWERIVAAQGVPAPTGEIWYFPMWAVLKALSDNLSHNELVEALSEANHAPKPS